MNYIKIYYNIINKALRKELSGQRWKDSGHYYEKHHIKPRSLGGSDEDKNLVLLTPKEHYLCHWLLVKSYDIDSIERRKMLKAWFLMSAIGSTKRKKITMRDYEKYKNELRKYMSIVRSGSNNGTYGFHWYTNYITGDYKLLKPPVTEEWIRGHHFYGEFCSISNNPNYRYKKVSNSLKEFYKNKTTKKEFKHPSKNYRKLTYFNPITLDKIKCKNKNIPKGYIKYERIFYTILYTQKLWDEYHSNNYKALSEFTKYSTWNAVAIKFNKYIPLYKKLGSIKQAGFPSNPDLIGKYE